MNLESTNENVKDVCVKFNEFKINKDKNINTILNLEEEYLDSYEKYVDFFIPVSYTHLDVYKRQPRDKLSNTQQRQKPGFALIFHALIARRYLRNRNATYFY